MNNNKLISRIILLLIIIGTGCHKDQKENPPPKNKIVLSEYTKTVDKFVWTGLHNYYLWADSVPNLQYSNFADSNALNGLIYSYSDPKNLFYSLLFKYKVVDKYSWIIDEYPVLDDQLKGITQSMGFYYGLYVYNSYYLLGVVNYVVDDSPASKAGMKRGDLFMAVEDQYITISNYKDLLFGNIYCTYTMAKYSGDTLYPSRKIKLTVAEVHENPIYYDTVFTINAVKIGYLVYNGFIPDYDIDLNNVFGYFKDNGVQKLILDLRYNAGGSGQSAIYLASMIYGTHTDQVFIKAQYNKDFSNYLKQTYGDDFWLEKFTDSIYATDNSPGALINSLNLSEVYIIATRNSASASELVINGLRPYMNVVFIGDTTYGKCVGSMAIKDYNVKGVLNSGHTWALQPIVVKAANALGYTDYVNGLVPTIEKLENPVDGFLAFGNQNETLLKTAINAALGIPEQSGMKSAGQSEFQVVADSKDMIPHGKEMYFNKRKGKSRQIVY